MTEIDILKEGVVRQKEELRQKEKEIELLKLGIKISHNPISDGKYNLYRKKFNKNGKTIALTSRTYYGLVEKVYDHVINDPYKLTFKDCFELALKSKTEEDAVKSATIDRIKKDYKRYILGEFGDRLIAEISDHDLKKYSKDLIINKRLSKGSFKKYLGVIRLAFGYALKVKHIIPYDTSSVIELKTYNNIYVEKAEKDQIFTEEEIVLIKTKIYERMGKKQYGPFYAEGYAILICILTGMRAGEICALQKEDDLGNYLHIHRQRIKQPDGTYTDVSYTKNERGRSKGGRFFPITKELRELLDIANTYNNNSRYIICKKDGSPLSPKNFGDVVYKLCKSLGLSVTRNHGFRKTLNSVDFYDAGFDEKERAAMLGHSVEVNLRNYSYDKKNSIMDKVEKLNDYYDKLTSTNPKNTINLLQYKNRKAL